MTERTPISHTVMRRVRTIRFLRALEAPVAASLLLAAALWVIGREVWVAKVLENMRQQASATDVLAFFANAFAHTDFLVQALTLLTLLATAWLIASSFRALHALPLRTI